jgi:hypothetical protein
MRGAWMSPPYFSNKGRGEVAPQRCAANKAESKRLFHGSHREATCPEPVEGDEAILNVPSDGAVVLKIATPSLRATGSQ